MELATVSIETFEGATYTFPDMDKDIFEKVLGHDDVWRRLGSLALTNVSGACLVIPTRVIKVISVKTKSDPWEGGEIKWMASPA